MNGPYILAPYGVEFNMPIWLRKRGTPDLYRGFGFIEGPDLTLYADGVEVISYGPTIDDTFGYGVGMLYIPPEVMQAKRIDVVAISTSSYKPWEDAVYSIFTTGNANAMFPDWPVDIQDLSATLAGVMAGIPVIYVNANGAGTEQNVLYGYTYNGEKSWKNQKGDWPDLSGFNSFSLIKMDDHATALPGTLTVVSPTGPTQEIKWVLTSANLTSANKGRFKAILTGNKTAGSEKRELWRGWVSIE